MRSTARRASILLVVGPVLLLWPARSPAGDGPRKVSALGTAQSQEVLNGDYYCSGSVFTDDQLPYLSAFVILNATSGILDGFSGPSASTRPTATDLAEMAAICEGVVEGVSSQIPSLCVIGPVTRESDEFGNGASTYVHFGFSCQGTRDDVIGVIGHVSRLFLTSGLQ